MRINRERRRGVALAGPSQECWHGIANAGLEAFDDCANVRARFCTIPEVIHGAEQLQGNLSGLLDGDVEKTSPRQALPCNLASVSSS